MDSTWRAAKWGDVATLEYGRALADYSDRSNGLARVFGTNGPIGYSDKVLAPGPGVVIGRKGAYRGVHYSTGDFWVIDTAFFLRPTAEIDMRWAYYELLTHDINAMDSGSAIPSTSRPAFYAMDVVVPPIAEQRAIAGVLQSLDAKIESNRRKCALLDALLMTEYRRIVRAGSATVRPLGELVEPGLGGAWGEDGPSLKSTVRVACLRGVDLAALAASELPSPPARWLSPSQYQTRMPGLGEIWVEGSGSFCGRSFLISPVLQRLFGDPICYSNFVKRLVPVGDPRVSTAAWLALRLAYESGEVAQARIGSAFPNLDVNALRAGVLVHVPSDPELEDLSKLAEARLHPAISKESHALAALRDTLLPELLSGRLRVREAEKVIEDVV